MFLYQKLQRQYKHIESDEDLQYFIDTYHRINPKIVVYDTETTGLNFMVDKPFLIGVGFEQYLFTFEPQKRYIKTFYDLVKNAQRLFAHNAKYDYHMMINAGFPIPSNIHLADSMTVARLTEYSDSLDGISLEELGSKYVDISAKEASKAIQLDINQINRQRLIFAKKELSVKFKDVKPQELMDAYKDRVQFVDHPWNEMFKYIGSIYQEPNYYDSYKNNPDLMKSYLADDLLLTLEYLRRSLPLLTMTDPDYRVLNQESTLIRVVGDMERNGLNVNIQYLLDSRIRIIDYIKTTYERLYQLTGRKFSSGQHKEIMKYFSEAHNIYMETSDMNALDEIVNNYHDVAKEVAELIIELRTLDKWLSTYVEGMLNRVHNGRIYTSINNSGAVTGRVSSDMQQQPKEALLSRDGKELFHPRRVFIADENSKIVYFDFSQMELRLQAHYTILISGGDENLCRAFIPFGYKSIFTGETFDYKKHDWNSNEWVDDKGNLWVPTDLHSVTTLKAFPHLTLDHPEFKKYRKLGKVANFLKNYGGGLGAIHRQLKVPEDIAQALNRGYYEAFPKVLDYQKWVEQQLVTYGYIENILGRRYYMQSQKWYYKAYNYLIQGGCADLMKQKEIRISNFLKEKGLKSKMLLPIHDEIQLSIPKDEEWIIPEIKAILDDNDAIIGTLPMLCEVEYTATSWADKEEFEHEGK